MKKGQKVIIYKLRKIGLFATYLGSDPITGISESKKPKFKIGSTTICGDYKFVLSNRPNRKKFRKVVDKVNEFYHG